MYYLEKKLMKMCNENENFERICLGLINSQSDFIINYQRIDYLFEKENFAVKTMLLKMFEMYKSVKRKIRKLLSRSVPVPRSIIFRQITSMS
jgi:hypothetical protein